MVITRFSVPRANLLLLFLLGCGSAALPTAALPAPCSPAAWAAVPASSRSPSSASLELRLRPLPADTGGVVAVSVVVVAAEARLSALRLPIGLRQPLKLRVTRERPGCDPATGRSPLEQSELQGAPGSLVALGAASSSAQPVRLQVDYQLELGETPGSAIHLDRDRFLAEGRQLFALPEGLDDAGAQTLVAIDASAYGPDGRAVSSLGLGTERRGRMTRHAIEEAIFAAGYLGFAKFDAAEGQDEMAWFGSPLFDPRPLAAEIASFRSAVREQLRDSSGIPLTSILSTELSLNGFEVRRAPASIMVRVAPDQVLSAQLRLSILHQVLKEWIGGRLSVVEQSGAEAVWFTEGWCRYLARELAFQFGLLSPLEYLEEINTLLAIQAVLGQPAHGAACAAEAATPGGAFSGCRNLLALARGALHAGQIDALLHARGKSLLELISRWLKSVGGPVTTVAWAAALEQDGGKPVSVLLEGFVRGAAIVPPSAAFGPCFMRISLRYSESSLGFDYRLADNAPASTLPPARWIATQVAEGSPAYGAGLREGTAIRAIDYVPYSVDRPIRVLLAEGQLLEYRGRIGKVDGVAWKRAAGVPDLRCLQR
ncbi:MAG: hypothetical protein ABI895_25100 [Deltaproteobacteria bacterium]